MKLVNDGGTPDMRHYVCELTKELDELSGLTEFDFYDFHHHYILVDKICIKESILAIRVPGGTVGGVWFDENNVITKIEIDTEYVVKTYVENVNEIIQKYVGQKLEL